MVDVGAQFQQPQLTGMPSMLPKRPEAKTPAFHDNAGSTYNGPIPGQMVMGVKHLGGDAENHITRGAHREPFYEVDRTGFINELGDSGRAGGRRWVSPVDIASNKAARPTVGLYNRFGGSHSGEEAVKSHWASQPLHQIPTDAPIHTGQQWQETLHGDDALDVHYNGMPEEHAEGRQRVNAIRASLQNGHPLRKAAWLVKREGRLYSLDGHHRVAAAREEGLSHFPAHVWDYDAHEKK